MARYTGPACRLCRRENTKLFLKGDKCTSDKCPLVRRAKAPGQHGASAGRKRVKEYGLQLREKQKARRYYGILEKQFNNYFEKADKKPGQTGENLLTMIETRLDNVVYRMGMADSRRQARQLVRHGHFQINGKKANIPSMLVKKGDVITVKESSRKSALIKMLIENISGRSVPAWIELDAENAVATIAALPN
ncbi:MAG: 30S ribosomal protein S4, partial [Clostridia bacterium]|nr:30S ribosomal protein S4 [Clostridia bacterium]